MFSALWGRIRRHATQRRLAPSVVNSVERLEERLVLANWSGDLPNGTVWLAGEVQRLVGDVRIPVGSTLTIQPGAVIKFDNYSVDMVVEGTLLAPGTSGSPIVFTELRDDAGGDTNGDGTASNPAASNWGRIEFTASSTASVLNFVDIRYGGFNTPGQVFVNGGQLTLSNSTIRNSAAGGVRINNSNPTLSGNTYRNNSGSAVAMDLASNPAISGVTMLANGVNSLVLDTGTLVTNGVWDDPDIVYWFSGDITVPQDKTLTIAPGQIIKRPYFGDLFVQGSLAADGTVAAPIIFTEHRDDTAGGDSNNNGTGSVPAAGNSGRIHFSSTSTGNVMDHVEVRYGGYESTAAVVVDGATLTYTNGIIRNSSVSGLHVKSSALLDVQNSLIIYNGDTGLRTESLATVAATNNTIDGNLRGITVDGPGTIVTLTNNLITHNFNVGIRRTNQGIAISAFNDVFNPGASEGNYNGLTNAIGSNGNISVDPKYVNRTTLDFHLQSDSPVIDAATSNAAPIDDLDFNFRVDTAAITNTGAGTAPFFDMGAYEFGGIPRAIKHSPSGAVSNVVSKIQFTFRAAMDTSSFSPSMDVLSFTGRAGALSITGFHWLNRYQLEVTFNQQAKAGNYQIVLGPGILDTEGNLLDVDADGQRGENLDDHYLASWTILPPRIVAQSAQEFTPAPIDHLDLIFDRPMDPSSFALADDFISFTGPNGAVAVTDFDWINTHTLRLLFDVQTILGPYELILGPNISDIGGNLLDQNRNGIPGETQVDSYTASFNLANIQFVGGPISQDTNWNGIIIVDDTVTIQPGVTLTISPGTIIKIRDLKGIHVQSGATLLSNGTTAQPVRITSIHDDTLGGDSEQNGDLILPQPGNWISIEIHGGTAHLNFTHLKYGGGSTSGTWNQSGMLRTTGNAVLNLTGCVLSDAFFDGVLTQGGTTTIANTIISGADRGIVSWLSGANVQVLNSTIVDNRIGLLGHGGTLNVVNSVVSHNIQFGIDNDINPDPSITYTNIFTPGGTNTRGFTNPVGTNGNLSLDPLFIDADSGNYRPGFGSPLIDAANGPLAPATDQSNAPRYDDPRTANTGVGMSNGLFADLGALEFIEGAPSNVDLTVIAVTQPLTAVGGQNIQVEWTTKNIGTVPASGAWHDGVYLSDDAIWSPDDLVLGTVLHSGSVPPNQSYLSSAEVRIPVTTPGNYFILVRANSDNALFEGVNVVNNTGPVDAAIEVSLNVPMLTLGTPFTDLPILPGEVRYYQLSVPSDQTVSVTLNGATSTGATSTGARELFVGAAFVPTVANFSFSSSPAGPMSQVLVIPTTDTGPYYLLVRNTSGQAATFTLLAQQVPFQINSVSPQAIGNGGFATITVHGALFTPGSVVTLQGPNNVTVTANDVQVQDGATLSALFDMTGRPVGAYQLKVTRPDNSSAIAPTTVQVTSAQTGSVTTEIITPRALRPGRNFSATIVIHNTGNNDAVLPLLYLSSHGAAKLGFSPDALIDSTLSIVPRVVSGPFGILPAGQSMSITVYGRLANDATSSLNLTMDKIEYTDTLVNDAQMDAMFPLALETMFGDRANEFRAYLELMKGNTNAEFLRSIHFVANELYKNLRPDQLLTVEDVWKNAMQMIILIVEEHMMDDFYAANGITFGDSLLMSASGISQESVTFGLMSQSGGTHDRDDVHEHELSDLYSSEQVSQQSAASTFDDRAGTIITTAHTPTDPNAPTGRVRYVLAGFTASEDPYAAEDWVRQVAYYNHCIYPNDTIKVVNWNSGTMGGFIGTTLASAGVHSAIGAGIGAPTGVGAIGGGLLGGLYGGIAGAINYYRIRANRTELVGAAIAQDIRDNGDPSQAFIYGHSLGAQSAGYAGKELNGQLGGIVAFDPAGEMFGGGPADRLDATDAQRVQAIHTSMTFGQMGLFGTNPENVGSENYYPPHLKWHVNAHAHSYEWFLGRLKDRCDEIMDGTVPPNTDPDLSLPPSTGSSNPNDSDPTKVGDGLEADGVSQSSTNIVQSLDPNHLLGPAGFGPQGFLRPGVSLPYMVQFENEPTKATAPAQEVFITNQLDPDMDWTSFAFGSFGFGAHSVSSPPGVQSFETFVSAANQDGSPLSVHIVADFNAATGLVFVTYRSLDPMTGQLPEDPFAGFLPVNDSTHIGEGFFSYTVDAKSTLATATLLTNQASIVFDTNPPLETPIATNTIDAGIPSSSITALPNLSSASFLVNWSGSDDAGGSQIAAYDVYVSDDNGPYSLWQSLMSATSAMYTGTPGHTYRFYSVAHDNVGHVEVSSGFADTSTTVEINTSPSIMPAQNFTVSGNAAGGVSIGTVVATDADVTSPNNSRFFSITSGNSAGAFTIDANSGVISVANAASLAAVAGQTVSLGITVTDGGTPALSATQDVTVAVVSTNTAPVLANPGPTATYNGKLKVPVKVFPTLTITDQDGLATLERMVLILPTSKGTKNPDVVSLPGSSSLGTRSDSITSGFLVITIVFNTGTTNAAVQTMLNNMTYATSKKGLKITTRDFRLQVTDRTELQSNVLMQRIGVRKK